MWRRLLASIAGMDPAIFPRLFIPEIRGREPRDLCRGIYVRLRADSTR